MNSPHKDTVLIAPLPEIDERLAAALTGVNYSRVEIEEMSISFLADVICQCNRQSRARSVVFYSRPAEREMLENYFLSSVEWRHVAPTERGKLIGAAIERAFREEQCRSLFLLLALHPTICSSIIERSLSLLTMEEETVMYGALSDGSPYLLGMSMPHPEFTGLGDGDFFDGPTLLRCCCATESGVQLLQTIPAIRSGADIAAVRADVEKLYEARGEYPKRSLAFLRQLDNTHGIKAR